MIKKIFLITTLLSLVGFAVFGYLARFAFKNYRERAYQIPQSREYESWDEVFNTPVDIEVGQLLTGSDTWGGVEPYISDIPVPQKAFFIKHPEAGDLLIDTGFNENFIDDPLNGNMNFFLINYRKSHKLSLRLKRDEDIISRLKEYNIKPERVFLTHMHLDHTAGLPSLPEEVDVVLDSKELNFFIYRMLTGHYLDKRGIKTLDFNKGYEIAPFKEVIDLIGDGSLFALSTSGHSAGHTSFLINSTKGKYLILGDMVRNREKFLKGEYANTDRGEEFENESKESFKMVMEFKSLYPEVEILFSHGVENY